MLEFLSQPKVDQLEVIVVFSGCQHKIFWLDISVDDKHFAVKSIQQLQNLSHYNGSVDFSQLTLGLDPMQQITAHAVFLD